MSAEADFIEAAGDDWHGSSMDTAEKPLNIMVHHWDLVSAIALVREFQEQAHQLGYNLCLGGGVLNNGFSINDLDVLAIPRSGTNIPAPGYEQLLDLFRPDPVAQSCTIEGPRRHVIVCRPWPARPPVDLIVFLSE